MGRASRANKQTTTPEPLTARPVTLPPEQYFRLASLVKDVQLAVQQAEQAVARVRQREQARDDYITQLSEQYPIVTRGMGYALDDATCTLTPMEPKP